MPNERIVFTSWKEIASYLGKGVRTVQRWEAELGLPIQRPDTSCKAIIRATRDDLDHWLAHRWSSRQLEQSAVREELALLRKRVAQLTIENAALKRELDQRERDRENASPSDSLIDHLRSERLSTSEQFENKLHKGVSSSRQSV